MLSLPWTNIFNDEELYNMRVESFSGFLKCKKPTQVEVSIEVARILNEEGLDSRNYPLVLDILRSENFNVIEALLKGEEPFEYFKKVQLNSYLVSHCFILLDAYIPGNVYDKTLQMIFGIIFRNYLSAKEGYLLHRLTIEDVNAIAKFLEKTKGQKDPVNRVILDILGNIGAYQSINKEDPAVDKIASHAIEIRNAFFDRTVSMDSVIPAELLERKDFRETAVMPRDVVPFST